MGYDIHRLAPGLALMIGGVEVPSKVGAVGHSDGDAALHAIIDALLGAAALGDIGQLFPDSDAAYAGIGSGVLLARALERVRQAGWAVSNVDVTVILQSPRLAPHIPAMRKAIATILGVDMSSVSVKAKTGEGLGEVGRGEAVACHAVAMVEAALPGR